MTQSSGDDIQVLVEDQQRINRFSKLNIRIKEIDGEIDLMKTRLQACSDALEEAEICLDAEGMLLTVGESFFQVSEEEAAESLEKAKNLTEEALTNLIEESEKTRLEMDELKKILYGKFGSSINLEDK